MPTVTFLPSGKKIQVAEGTSVFDAATQAGFPVASSCSANFVCGRCNIQVVVGRDNLSPPTQAEKKLLEREKHPPTDRISCQAKVHGNCTITTRYW